MRQQHVTLVPHTIKRFSRRLFGNLLHTAARAASHVWEAKGSLASAKSSYSELSPQLPQPDAESVARLPDYGRRWASGESIAGFSRQPGMSWNRLWSELTKLGYTKGA